MQLKVNTYANSIIESSVTLMKFMEVLMNVYLRYSLNDCIFCVNEQQKVHRFYWELVPGPRRAKLRA